MSRLAETKVEVVYQNLFFSHFDLSSFQRKKIKSETKKYMFKVRYQAREKKEVRER